MDKDFFVREIEASSGMLYRVAYTILRNDDACKDALQDTALKAWEKRRTLKEPRYFRTWITRILIGECVNIQRKQKRSVPVEQLPEAAQDEDGRVVALREALEQLPRRHRTMIVLHYMEGYDVRETARIMSTTKGAVCAGLSRARQRLKEMVGEEMDV